MLTLMSPNKTYRLTYSNNKPIYYRTTRENIQVKEIQCLQITLTSITFCISTLKMKSVGTLFDLDWFYIILKKPCS